MMRLLDHDPELGLDLLETPEVMTRIFHEVLDEKLKPGHPTILQDLLIHCRFFNFPQVLESVFLKFVPRSIHAGRLVSFKGTVTRTGLLKLYEAKKRFVCGRCNEIIEVDFDVTTGGYPKPSQCTGKDDDENCRSYTFKEFSTLKAL